MRCHLLASSLQLDNILRLEQVARVMSVMTRPGWCAGSAL